MDVAHSDAAESIGESGASVSRPGAVDVHELDCVSAREGWVALEDGVCLDWGSVL
jgi:hypothetical protein